MKSPILNKPVIRVIGDTVLQSPGIPFPDKPSKEEMVELKRQIGIAKDALIATGGAGIAANQCAAIKRPYQFTIVGVFHQNPVHVKNVEKRYPGIKFPEAVIMINPKIKNASAEMKKFYHGCLSIPGSLRGEIMTPQSMTVEYKTLNQDEDIITQTKTVSDMAAVALKHELNHILSGKTYIDCCFSELNPDDLASMKSILSEEKENRKTKNYMQKPTDDFYRFAKIDENDGTTQLNEDALRTALKICITTETLHGLIAQLTKALKLSVVKNDAAAQDSDNGQSGDFNP